MAADRLIKTTRSTAVLLLLLMLSGCSSRTLQNFFNPFYEEPTQHALAGELNDEAISNRTNRAQDARAALEKLATYQRQHLPQPANPVMRPSVVRLMWIPDHLNKFGDMVPAHYYYLKVLDEQWQLQDAFDIADQLNHPHETSSVIPYVEGGK
jgi:hypothetical protein